MTNIDEKLKWVTIAIVILLALPLVAYFSSEYIFIYPVVGVWRGSVIYVDSPDQQSNTAFTIMKDGKSTIVVDQEIFNGEYYVTKKIVKNASWMKKGNEYYMFIDNKNITLYLQNDNKQIYLSPNDNNGSTALFQGWLYRENSI